MAEREVGHVVHLVHEVGHRVANFRSAKTGGDAEKPGAPVHDLVAVLVPVVHALGTHNCRGASLKDRWAVNGIQ